MFKFSLLFLLFYPAFISAQTPVPTSGSIKHYADFRSKYVDARDIDVWLPDDYDPEKKYAVLYMNDGRDMFDKSDTNPAEWNLDETLSALTQAHKIKDVIVVAIYNNDELRQSEYFPQKVFEMLSQQQQDSLYAIKIPMSKDLFFAQKIMSDTYLKFIVKELKPFIDRSFPVYKDKENTFIGGSSMGALLAMYAICEYPEKFGAAACLSPHWPGVMPTKNTFFPNLMLSYLDKHIPSSADHVIYFDHGDKTLDYFYGQTQIRIDSLFAIKGYTLKNYLSLKFSNADHSTKAWGARIDQPLLFLLKPKEN